MNRKQAQEIIKNTFENAFEKQRFTYFIKNLLNNIDEDTFIYQGNYIPDAYKPYIKSLERIGKYNDGENIVDILIITLLKETSLERARTMQRNFIAWYLNGSRGGIMKDAALVAFVSPNPADWRFSLVKMDYKFEKTPEGNIKIREEFTPARRWSFLVGVNEKSHTAQSRLVSILANDEQAPTLEEIENAFNIEIVTKEFFLKYRQLFIRTKEALDKVVENNQKVKTNFQDCDVDTVNFAKKLLGQIVFLYFLQKKGWFGVGRDDDYGEGSKHFLRDLFEGKHGEYDNFFNDILEPLFYEALRIDRSHDDDYYSRFNCKIPFLNGGLFDPIGNYDWVHTDIHLPNDLFSNKRKTKEGDIGDGILDIFDRYNFTVREDEPLEKEVAIDPELLGKAYEKFNAIRPDNFDEFIRVLKSGNKGEENKFNKNYGVYYTPREIVHFMCQQSLINYLATELEGTVSKEDIEELIHTGEQVTENEQTALLKEQRIKAGKQKSSDYKLKLPESVRNNALLIDKKLKDIAICDPAVGSGAFPVGMMNEIIRVRNVLSIFLDGSKRNRYEFKRHCIEHSLYGVDIDPGAVEIAKLRLWLSLVVDEENYKFIKPLPNLDYKIICGDSLLNVEKNLFNNELYNKLEKIKPQFFQETNPARKMEYKEQIDKIISQITEGHQEFDFEVYFSEVFHEKGGFDLVIGNPPYIQLQKMKGNPMQQVYKNQGFSVYDSTGDIYCLFYERGLEILKNNGHLTYITSNKWMRARYGEKLRKFFLTYNPKILIDLGPGIFESATVDTSILIIQKAKNARKTLGGTINKLNQEINDITYYLKSNGVILSNLGNDAWFIGSRAEVVLKNKIERIGRPLKDWDVNIYYGIKTGLNEAFVIDTETKEEICSKDPKSIEIIKPILRGRDIKRYSYKWAGLWLIASGFDIDVPRLYPAVYQHLKQFEDRAKKRYDQGKNWWNLRACDYYSEFEKEKLVWTDISTEPAFVLLPEGFYFNNTVYMIACDEKKYFLGVLNSKIIKWYFPKIASDLGKKGNRYFKIFVELLPIPPITSQNRSIVNKVEQLVDKILITKNKNSNADTIDMERQIDHLVYQLYDLTAEEIKLIEEEK
jgi:hypothetical protein